jgi:hypothetical protein
MNNVHFIMGKNVHHLLFRQLNVRLQDVLLLEDKGQVTVNHTTDTHAHQQVRLRFM